MISLSDSVWNVPCSKLIGKKPVITIDAEEPLESACQILIKNRITSAPVFDKKSNSYVGMFDYRDIVEYVLIVFNRKDLSNISQNDSIDISEIIKLVRSGKSITAKNASGKEKINP